MTEPTKGGGLQEFLDKLSWNTMVAVLLAFIALNSWNLASAHSLFANDFHRLVDRFFKEIDRGYPPKQLSERPESATEKKKIVAAIEDRNKLLQSLVEALSKIPADKSIVIAVPQEAGLPDHPGN